MIWLSKALVLAVHDRQLSEHGGQPGVRDVTLLDSALARPQQRHAYGDPPPDLAELAASLAYGLARNPPFLDGNKRTAHICYRLLLALNGGRTARAWAERSDDELRIAAMSALQKFIDAGW